jgi:hypothetical protein
MRSIYNENNFPLFIGMSIGASSSTQDSPKAGTLGAFLHDNNGTYYGLTAQHVTSDKGRQLSDVMDASFPSMKSNQLQLIVCNAAEYAMDVHENILGVDISISLDSSLLNINGTASDAFHTYALLDIPGLIHQGL